MVQRSLGICLGKNATADLVSQPRTATASISNFRAIFTIVQFQPNYNKTRLVRNRWPAAGSAVQISQLSWLQQWWRAHYRGQPHWRLLSEIVAPACQRCCSSLGKAVSGVIGSLGDSDISLGAAK